MQQFEINEKLMDRALEIGLGRLEKNYGLEKLDAGKFAEPITMNTKFNIAHYDVKSFGHLQTMRTEGNPMMQMVTFTLTPYEKNIPLLSADFMYGADKGMIIIELYELVKDRSDAQFREWMKRFSEKLSVLSQAADVPVQPCFYDEIRPVFACKARTPQFDEAYLKAFEEVLELLIEMEKSYPALDGEERRIKHDITAKYVDQLIDENGSTTAMWVKEHGEPFVREFYHKVFFGPELY